jgi:hypothetical protein
LKKFEGILAVPPDILGGLDLSASRRPSRRCEKGPG